MITLKCTEIQEVERVTNDEMTELAMYFCRGFYKIPGLAQKLGVENRHKFSIDFEIPSFQEGYITFYDIELTKIEEKIK